MLGFEMKLGWGKTVPIPPHPIYVPQTLLEQTMPPPPSGLPFSAQPKDPNKKSPGLGVPPEFADQDDFLMVGNNIVITTSSFRGDVGLYSFLICLAKGN